MADSGPSADGGAYASILARLAAYALDCGLLFAGLLLWQTAIAPINPIVASMRRGQPLGSGWLHLWVFATASLPFLLYFAATQSSRRQATIGMRLLGLRVATADGSRLNFARAVARCAVMLVPFELNHAVLFHLMPQEGEPWLAFAAGSAAVTALIAGYLAAIAMTPRRQSLHDLVAGTVVRRVR